MSTSDHIITQLGGVANVARECGFPLTTVQGWKDANFIPEWRQEAVMNLARRKEVKIAKSDFPSVSERIPRAERSAA